VVEHIPDVWKTVLVTYAVFPHVEIVMKPDEVVEAEFEATVEDATELSGGRELLVRIELLVMYCDELDRVEEAPMLDEELDKPDGTKLLLLVGID